MLVELRVENLGIIAELLLPLGAGLTVITGETGAGKTLIVDALDLLCGGRADAVARARRRRRGAGRGSLRRRRRRGRARARRSRATGARAATSTGGSRPWPSSPSAGRALVDLHGQHAHQSLLVPAEQRALLDRFAGEPAAAARADAARPRARRGARVDDELAEIGGDDRSRARQLDLLRYELDEIDAAGIEDADEDATLAAEEEILADAEAHREALEDAHAQLEGAGAGRARRRDRRGRARASRSRRSPTGCARCRSRPRRSAHDVRVAAEQIVADPQRLADVQQRRARLRELVRKYGPTLADVQAYARRGARARSRSSRATRRGPRRSTAALADADRAVARGRARAVGGPRAGAPARSRPRSRRNLRELAMPAATLRGRGRARRLRRRRATTAPTRSRSCWRRTRASRPGRWPGPRPAASSPARCWPCGSCSPRRRRPSCSTRSTPVSAARPAPRSGARWRRWEASTRCCA